jgi:hypothetical protein
VAIDVGLNDIRWMRRFFGAGRIRCINKDGANLQGQLCREAGDRDKKGNEEAMEEEHRD